MNIDQYIKEVHKNRDKWFIDEVSTVSNQSRVLNVMKLKGYLDGDHKIIHRQPEKYNGKEFYPRKIVLQYAKTILNFQSAYLLKNPITLTGNESVVEEYQRIQKKGKYDKINLKILDKVIKYGQVAEYVYMDDNKQIKSKIIDPADSFPVYDHENNLIAFIESYTVEGVDYYTVFTNDTVYKYDNNGGRLRKRSEHINLSGLPIIYHNQNEMSEVEGKSDLDDLIPILDNMEDLISKYTDSFYKYMNPIPVVIGQQLKGNGLPKDVVGGGINLEEYGDMKMLSNQMDSKSFETLYKTLLQALLDISSTPAVSMNKTDISNLSEVSIKLLFSLADVKAGWNELFMREGIFERFEKIRTLLAYKDINYSDEDIDTLDVVFRYNMPSNDKEVIENLKALRDMQGISIESLLDHSPYTNDVQMELKKLSGEGEKIKVEKGNGIEV
ncbi:MULTISPECIES: phage portal protein [Bacillaceae]|uniref:Phage portal protein n=1 Tax=Evansella alkalicola TaxID=745819 RepID=A0ABS6JPQ9_9BACI|nr:MULTISPECIES: phage portal protein [Bacillaceae]MBU9720544.1 phage portal protein [Bacillus alkalicola]